MRARRVDLARPSSGSSTLKNGTQALFDSLDNTGSNAETNFGTALDAAETFYDAQPDASDVMYYLSDDDNTTINNDPLISDALMDNTAVAAASREAWIVPNFASDLEGDNPPGDAFNQLDNTGAGVDVVVNVTDIGFGLV